ncbi:MAG: class I SAM-dependent methyltransferase [Candidatus Cloacimonadota bacterium]|nr:MAG: class I SAM-dependent methyltransferase [Candidatus Cloacimonadota bacterium]
MVASMRERIDRILKHLLDNRLNWNLFEGPFYDFFIYHAIDVFYREFYEHMSLPEQSRILDVGSGAGQLTLLFARRYPEAEITGIDFSSTQTMIANFLKKRKHVTNCHFRQADALNLPFKNETFDMVTSFASIKHWQDGRKGLKEIRRVMKDGAAAYIVECDACASYEEIEQLARGSAKWEMFYKLIAWYQYHVVFGKSYTRKAVELLARSAGFDDIYVEKARCGPLFQMMLRK